MGGGGRGEGENLCLKTNGVIVIEAITPGHPAPRAFLAKVVTLSVVGYGHHRHRIEPPPPCVFGAVFQ